MNIKTQQRETELLLYNRMNFSDVNIYVFRGVILTQLIGSVFAVAFYLITFNYLLPFISPSLVYINATHYHFISLIISLVPYLILNSMERSIRHANLANRLLEVELRLMRHTGEEIKEALPSAYT